MAYQKIVNLLDNTSNQPSKFRIKNCIKINDDSCGTYDTGSQVGVKLQCLTSKSKLFNYNDA